MLNRTGGRKRRPAALRLCGWMLAAWVLLLSGAAARAEILINEVMASNGFFENGHAWDWVELYNNGDAAVDLSGWYLSDSKNNPLKWSFPNGTKLKAGR